VHFLEPITGSAWLRQRHPYEKLAFWGGLLVLCLILPPPAAILVLATTSTAACTIAHVPLWTYCKILLLPAGFILAGITPLLVSLSFGPDGIGMQWATGQTRFALYVGIRALAASATLGLLAVTTPPAEWIPLLHKTRIPAFITDMMLVIYRLIFVIMARFTAMHTAQEARLGYTSIKNTFYSSGQIGANLLVASLKRAQAMDRGLAARGFQQELPFLPPEQKISAPVISAILVLHAILTMASLLLRHGVVS